MTAPTLQKTRINGYNLIHVQNSWLVCTEHDRLASFATEEEARAYAFSLPAHKAART
jgi:hypothetical protein